MLDNRLGFQFSKFDSWWIALRKPLIQSCEEYSENSAGLCVLSSAGEITDPAGILFSMLKMHCEYCSAGGSVSCNARMENILNRSI